MQGSITNWLIGIGIALVIAGVLAKTGVLGSALGWFGHLPGDIRIKREGFQLYLPLTSMILVSILLSAVLALVRRFF